MSEVRLALFCNKQQCLGSNQNLNFKEFIRGVYEAPEHATCNMVAWLHSIKIRLGF